MAPIAVEEETLAPVASTPVHLAVAGRGSQGSDERDVSAERELVSLAVDVPLQSAAPVASAASEQGASAAGDEDDLATWLQKTADDVKATKVIIADIGNIEQTIGKLRVSKYIV